jgi:hypothetical protein
MMPIWGKLAVAGIAGARATRRQVMAIVTSKRLGAALREAYDFIIDFAVVLGVATAGAVLLTAALLLAAPPV